jgi:hypothetical protein
VTPTPTATVTPSVAQTNKEIYVNIYGGSNPYSGSEWNNWAIIQTGETTNIGSSAFNYTDGSASSIGAFLDISTAIDDMGSTYGAGATIFPQQTLRYGSRYTGNRSFSVTGLTNTNKYKIEIIGSSNSQDLMTVTAVGKTITFYQLNNITQSAVFDNVTPTGNSINFVLNRAGAAVFHYINAFKITELLSGVTITPTPTLSVTPSATQTATPTLTPTLTPTISVTPSATAPAGSMPYFLEAGTGNAIATTGAITVSYPVTNVLANDLLIMQITVRNSTTTVSTPSGWTIIGSVQNIGSTTTARQYLFYKLASGSESGTQSVSFGSDAAVCKMGRMYRFRRNATSSPIGAVTTANGTGTAVNAPNVTVSSGNTLVCAFVAIANDDAIGSFTGETGGNWVEMVSEFTTTSGSDGCIQVQTISNPAVGTISGGTYNIALSDPWGIQTVIINS